MMRMWEINFVCAGLYYPQSAAERGLTGRMTNCWLRLSAGKDIIENGSIVIYLLPWYKSGI